MNETVSNGRAVAFEIPETRQKFLNKTYYHLLGAILLLVGIEVFLFKSGFAQPIAATLMSVNWLIILGIFMVASGFADSIAHKNAGKSTQYIAMFAYVLLWAIMLVPLLAISMMKDPSIIQSAATVTLVGFGVLTGIVMFTGKDFSFMRSLLMWLGGAAIIGIIASVLFGFTLGTWFSVGMVAYSGAAILYNTSKVLHDYPEGRYVGAALSLFSSIALMFWYVAQIFLSGD